MAAACYEKEITLESINSYGLGGQANSNHHHVHHHHHHHHHHRNTAASNSSHSTSSSPASASRTSSATSVTAIGQTLLSPTASNDIVSPYKAEPTPGTNFKDYAQPLHVDCSVEYELPSQAKPPPGGGEPLLMIHPCYYRRAERERRSPFVNNLPPMVSSSRKASRRSDTSSLGQSHVSKAMITGGDAASVAATVVATATAAVTANVHTNANSALLLGDALTTASPSCIAINTLLHSRKRQDDEGNNKKEIDKKRLGQQQHQHQQHHRAFSTVPNGGNLTSADEKAVISGIYQHYFRAMRSTTSHHHQPHHQNVQQPTHPQVPTQPHHHLYDDGHFNSSVTLTTNSPATGTYLQNFQVPAEPVSTASRRRTSASQHYPYRRPTSSISRAPTAVPTIPSTPSNSSVYATAMNRHREASLQALRVAAAAVAAAAAAAAGGSGNGNGNQNNSTSSGSFCEAPAYRALLPRS